MLFATYGVVLDIVAIRNQKMRGQAHIVFRDVDSSTQAMRALQGFDFFGKQMVGSLAYSFWKLSLTFNIENSICQGQIPHDRETGWHVQDSRERKISSRG